jgi:hypothetical protein
MPEGLTVAVVILRAIGALAGAALALLVKPSQTRTEFFMRLSGSIIAGIVFAPTLREWLKWDRTEDHIIASAALVSFGAWWALAGIIRAIEKVDWTKK